MTGIIEFYYEFSSPYGYLASQLIDDFAVRFDRTVVWKPFLLGAVMKETGGSPLVDIPLKGDYSKRDIERSAAYYGVPFVWPSKFPVFAVYAARAALWAGEKDPQQIRTVSCAMYDALFKRGGDVSSIEDVLGVCERLGFEREAVEAGLLDAAVKQRLKDETAAAMNRKVFGSPFFFIDGEPFWGVDRLPQMERWLETGGW